MSEESKVRSRTPILRYQDSGTTGDERRYIYAPVVSVQLEGQQYDIVIYYLRQYIAGQCGAFYIHQPQYLLYTTRAPRTPIPFGEVAAHLENNNVRSYGLTSSWSGCGLPAGLESVLQTLRTNPALRHQVYQHGLEAIHAAHTQKAMLLFSDQVRNKDRAYKPMDMYSSLDLDRLPAARNYNSNNMIQFFVSYSDNVRVSDTVPLINLDKLEE